MSWDSSFRIKLLNFDSLIKYSFHFIFNRNKSFGFAHFLTLALRWSRINAINEKVFKIAFTLKTIKFHLCRHQSHLLNFNYNCFNTYEVLNHISSKIDHVNHWKVIDWYHNFFFFLALLYCHFMENDFQSRNNIRSIIGEIFENLDSCHCDFILQLS